MAKAIQRRRGTTVQHASFTGLAGEITVDTDKKVAVIHDGSTAGGNPLLSKKGGEALAGGFTADSYSLGTITTGTVTPSAANGNFQHLTANGAFTLAPPSATCCIDIEVLNGASAGAITTSGFTKVNGDTYATTNAIKFIFHITKTQNYSRLSIEALQ